MNAKEAGSTHGEFANPAPLMGRMRRSQPDANGGSSFDSMVDGSPRWESALSPWLERIDEVRSAGLESRTAESRPPSHEENRPPGAARRHEGPTGGKQPRRRRSISGANTLLGIDILDPSCVNQLEPERPRARARARALGETSGVRIACTEPIAAGRLAAFVAWSEVIVDSVQEAVITLTPTGTICGWNVAAERLYGYTLHEAMGRSIDLLVPPERMAEIAPLRQAALENRAIEPYETIRKTKDGRRIEVSVNLCPVVTEDGEFVGVVAFSCDATSVRQGEHRSDDEGESPSSAHGAPMQTRHRSLQKQLSERTRLTSNVLRLQDEARRDIARELHDSTGQNLVALAMDLDCIHRDADRLSPVGKRALVRARSMVDQCTAEVRTIAHLLHPPLLDEMGLASAVRWYIEGFEERSGIRCRASIDADLGRLNPDVEMAFFRVLQESLTNVVRHSQSPSVEIRLRLDGGTAVLEIEDHGRGIERGRGHRRDSDVGVGVMGMRERMLQLGGHLLITSSSAGTIVQAVAPARRSRLAGVHKEEEVSR